MLRVKSIYIRLFGVGNGGLGLKMCGCVREAWGSNGVHNQAKLSSAYCSEDQGDQTLIQQCLIKRVAGIETIYALGVEVLPFYTANLPFQSELNTSTEYLYNASSSYRNPGDFLSASRYVEEKKRKELESEGTVDNERSRLISRCCGRNNAVLAKDAGGYTNGNREGEMFEN